MGSETILYRRWAVVVPCAISVLLCLRGLPEAVAHPDQMAFQPLFHPDKAPFNPGWFEKPPFHSYFNYFLSVAPIDLLGLSPESTTRWQTLWSKLLQVLLFAGTVAVLHDILRRMVRAWSALAIAALFATSAGMVAHAHFLTADVAVTFWMLLAFRFCQRLFERGQLRDYAAAGLLTGLATATKYNGLGVGIAIPVAHLAAQRMTRPARDLVRSAFSPVFAMALALVGVGFVIGNPFALFDFRAFYGDFAYNWAVAPVYEGQTGSSYLHFFVALAEAVGIPVLLMAGVAGAWAVYQSFVGGMDKMPRATVWMAAAVLVLYYAKFAPFPRLENRFVLPIAPYLLILAAPALDKVAARARRPAMVLLAVLLAYNLACSIAVGDRFLNDPRVRAATALPGVIRAGARIEADIYSTGLAPQYACCEMEMPFLTGRERLFSQLFAGNEALTGSPDILALAERNVIWFTPEALAARRPDYIVTGSNYYGRFLEPGLRRDLYPSVRDYFSKLLAGRLGYRVVADLRAPAPRPWAYPRSIDFLDNRLVVLKAKGT